MTITTSRVCLLAIGTFLSCCGSLLAQEGALSDLYGRGVHAYFRGDMGRAFQDFDTVVQKGSHDPRVYYFRGLTYLAYGDEMDAVNDFTVGAQMEATGGSFYDVGKSLERIQGPRRYMIENYRLSARVSAVRLREQNRSQNYQGQPPAPASNMPMMPPAGAPAGEMPAATEPAAPGAEMPAEETPPPAAAPSDNPFGAP